MKKAIGIVGGVGPYAGLDLNRKVFDNMKTDGTDQDYLNVYLLSRSSDIPDRTKYLQGKIKKNPAFGIYRTILKLDSLGCEVAAIPCNTAHSPDIYDEVVNLMTASRSNVKLLHIVHETYKFLAENYPKLKKIGLLGTIGTYDTKLYENYFSKKGKMELIIPTKQGQEKIHDAIYNTEYGIKAQATPVSKKAKKIFESQIDDLVEKGAKAVILGCTEIPLAFEGMDEYKGLQLIDPTNILARALIKSCDKNYLKKI